MDPSIPNERVAVQQQPGPQPSYAKGRALCGTKCVPALCLRGSCSAPTCSHPPKTLNPQPWIHVRPQMQQLMEEGDYFSASSLEFRAPSIYHEYVGESDAPPLPCLHLLLLITRVPLELID